MVTDTSGSAFLLPLLIAPFVGSFLGVLIVRLPAGSPVMLGRSACPACGARLGWVDMVPLFSFLVLRGRCRHCRETIGWFHPAVELAAIAIAVSALLGDQPQIWVSCGLGWSLLTLACIDWSDFLLPDVLTLPLLLAGLIWTFDQSPEDLVDHCAAVFIGYGSFEALAAIYRRIRGRDGLGGGDSKLIAAVGAWCGLSALPMVIFGSAIIGLLAGAGLAAAGRSVTATTRIPFGTCIALSFWLVWNYGDLFSWRF